MGSRAGREKQNEGAAEGMKQKKIRWEVFSEQRRIVHRIETIATEGRREEERENAGG
jgi:hypothetical protein